MISTVYAHTCSLIGICQSCFGNDHVMARHAVTYKINKVVDHYNNHVHANSHRKVGKNKNQGGKRAEKPKCVLNKQWRFMHLSKSSKLVPILPNALKPAALTLHVSGPILQPSL